MCIRDSMNVGAAALGGPLRCGFRRAGGGNVGEDIILPETPQ